jgi:hypothetical protein
MYHFYRFLFYCYLFINSTELFAQNENDLFRFSKTSYGGSARFEGMGGAFGALGADLSCSQINPAGFGRFSSNQFNTSFYGGAASNQTAFNGIESNSNTGQAGIINFGCVIAEDVSRRSRGHLFRQFGFNFNEIENFKTKIYYEGQQFSSLLDQFTNQAQGFFPEELNTYFPFSSDLAYQTGLIQYNAMANNYYSLLNNGDVFHRRYIEQNGKVREFNFNLSTNYLNRLYVGANVGLRYFRFEESFNHEEELIDTSNTDLRSFTYNNQLFTKGKGLNIKIGLIYLPISSIRIGFAVHSPTFAELTDEWTANMTSTFSYGAQTIPQNLAPLGNYKYRIRNPFKIVGSLAFIIRSRASISADFEYVDYKQAHFKSTKDLAYSPYNFEYENFIAKQVFKPAINFRTGAEFLLTPILYLRAGFGFYGNAFKPEENAETSSERFYSTGIGVKINGFSIDMSYRLRTFGRNYYAFSESQAAIKYYNSRIVVSATLQF